jgi:hypothetical protein
VADIYQLVGGTNVFTDIAASDVGTNIANAIQRSLGEQERRGLRLSGLGPTCPKALWHASHTPELAEPLPPYAKIKYTYGHIIEHLIIGLAKAAGHEVTGEQDEIIVDGILGHRDCVIDGCIVDVKSASSRSFQSFRDKTIGQNDTFGYLDQLDAYTLGSMGDPLVRTKDRAYLLAVDKTLGHLTLYEHKLREQNIRSRIQEYRRIVERLTPPSCNCGTVPDGKSGNIKLDVKASYNSFKYVCKPTLRTFLYASGPVYLTKVMRTPDVPEITRAYVRQDSETEGRSHTYH